MSANANEAVSTKILAIRSAAGNDCETCPTCGRPASNPYRRILDGKIIEGCIDAAHTPALTGYTANTSAWHFRKEAVAIRRNTLASLRARS